MGSRQPPSPPPEVVPVEALPNPIAEPLRQFREPCDVGFVRLHRMLDASEAFVKYVASVAASAAFAVDGDGKAVCSKLTGAFVTPSLGAWDQLMQGAVGVLSRQRSEPSVPAWKSLVGFGTTKVRGVPVKTSDLSANPTNIAQALSLFAQLRNHHAHGATAIDDSEYLEDVTAFSPLFEEVLRVSRFLCDWPLVVGQGEPGQSTRRAWSCMGASNDYRTLQLPFAVPVDEPVVIFDETAERFASLLPLVVFHRCERERCAKALKFFFFNDAKKLNRAASIAAASINTLDYSFAHRAQICGRAPVLYQERFLANVDAGAQSWHDQFADQLASGFVGREKEVSTVIDVAENSRQRAIIVVGPPGIGKSAFIARCAQQLRERGHAEPVLLFLRRDRGDTTRPERFLTDLRDAVLRLLGKQGSQKDAGDPASLQKAVAAALAEYVSQERRDKLKDKFRTLAIFVDGLDEAQAEDLSWLPTELPDSGVTLVLSCRPEAARDHLGHVVRALHPAPPIELTGVSDTAVRAMLWNAVSKYELDDKVVRQVAQRSGGNPLYVRLIVEQMLRDPGLEARIDWLPSGLRGLYAAELASLSPKSRELLRLLAAAHDSLTLSQIADILRTSVEDARATLAPAFDLVIDDPSTPDIVDYMPYHASLTDFMIELATRDGERPPLASAHLALAEYCRRVENDEKQYGLRFRVKNLAHLALHMPEGCGREAVVRELYEVVGSAERRKRQIVETGEPALALDDIRTVLAVAVARQDVWHTARLLWSYEQVRAELAEELLGGAHDAVEAGDAARCRSIATLLPSQAEASTLLLLCAASAARKGDAVSAVRLLEQVRADHPQGSKSLFSSQRYPLFAPLILLVPEALSQLAPLSDLLGIACAALAVASPGESEALADSMAQWAASADDRARQAVGKAFAEAGLSARAATLASQFKKPEARAAIHAAIVAQAARAGHVAKAVEWLKTFPVESQEKICQGALKALLKEGQFGAATALGAASDVPMPAPDSVRAASTDAGQDFAALLQQALGKASEDERDCALDALANKAHRFAPAVALAAAERMRPSAKKSGALNQIANAAGAMDTATAARAAVQALAVDAWRKEQKPWRTLRVMAAVAGLLNETSDEPIAAKLLEHVDSAAAASVAEGDKVAGQVVVEALADARRFDLALDRAARLQDAGGALERVVSVARTSAMPDLEAARAAIQLMKDSPRKWESLAAIGASDPMPAAGRAAIVEAIRKAGAPDKKDPRRLECLGLMAGYSALAGDDSAPDLVKQVMACLGEIQSAGTGDDVRRGIVRGLCLSAAVRPEALAQAMRVADDINTLQPRSEAEAAIALARLRAGELDWLGRMKALPASVERRNRFADLAEATEVYTDLPRLLGLVRECLGDNGSVCRALTSMVIHHASREDRLRMARMLGAPVPDTTRTEEDVPWCMRTAATMLLQLRESGVLDAEAFGVRWEALRTGRCTHRPVT